ncbi:hypothetical protein MB84_29440 (plasmid) [Pandoraea oxalativorans]|uniref:Uncharacterized protein n=1 Tax=Pandoraea oxalativorans TaxID=573737 RepID=A0A0G3IIF7_9BURK|nr:hypothetical protein MB84_29440 [Pandoraea oxalativorans]
MRRGARGWLTRRGGVNHGIFSYAERAARASRITLCHPRRLTAARVAGKKGLTGRSDIEIEIRLAV